MKGTNLTEENELHTLLNHCIERLPQLKQGLLCDCVDELPTTISFESPSFIITMKLERKKELKPQRRIRTALQFHEQQLTSAAKKTAA